MQLNLDANFKVPKFQWLLTLNQLKIQEGLATVLIKMAVTS